MNNLKQSKVTTFILLALLLLTIITLNVVVYEFKKEYQQITDSFNKEIITLKLKHQNQLDSQECLYEQIMATTIKHMIDNNHDYQFDTDSVDNYYIYDDDRFIGKIRPSRIKEVIIADSK